MSSSGKNMYDTLVERGFFKQCTDEEGLRRLFDEEQVTVYIGFDPTARSLHAGSLVGIMALRQLQEGGHRPIALVGGGTGLIGDPSGRTEQRQLLSRENLRKNFDGIRAQLGRFLDFHGGAAIAVDNAEVDNSPTQCPAGSRSSSSCSRTFSYAASKR